jgi:carbonic anhydrase
MREDIDPKTRLVDGNATFRRVTDPTVLSHLSKSHEPFVAILTCSDARIDPAKVFSLSLGDAFVVRTAGNTATDQCVVGSLEYAVSELHVTALLVLGHTGCGAIKATYDCCEQGNLEGVFREIESAKSRLGVSESKDPTAVAASNVRMVLRKLVDTSVTIRDAVAQDRLEMLGAVLDIGNGNVEFI